MQFRELGKSGIQTSVIGIGTWAIGGWMWGGTDEKQSIEAIQAGLDHGVNLVDTAPVYGFGLSEEVVGKAIAGRRDRVVLATKCGLRWDAAQGEFFFEDKREGRKVYRWLKPEEIRKEVEASLRRLGTDVIDLYQTHWQDKTTPIADTMAALLRLKDEGKIRAIGVSNVSVEQLRQYLDVGIVDSAQEKYSLLDPHIEADGLLPFCRERGVSLLAYSPLELGLLTGKVTAERTFEEGDQRRGHPLFSPENRRRVGRFLDQCVAPIAAARDATIAQVIIAWTLARPGVTFALVGARNASQGKQNALAGDLALSGAEIAAIEKAAQALKLEE